MTTAQHRGLLSADEAAAEQKRDNAFLLDVRGFDEFAAGHAASAVCVPCRIWSEGPANSRRIGRFW